MAWPTGRKPTEAVAVVLAFIWRLATYYPYLVVGIALLPRWMQRNFGRKR